MMLLILVLMLLTAKLTKKNVNALYLLGAEQIVAGSIVSFVISNALSSIVMELSNSYLKTSVLIERAPFEKAGSYSIVLGILLIASAMFAAFKKVRQRGKKINILTIRGETNEKEAFYRRRCCNCDYFCAWRMQHASVSH